MNGVVCFRFMLVIFCNEGKTGIIRIRIPLLLGVYDCNNVTKVRYRDSKDQNAIVYVAFVSADVPEMSDIGIRKIKMLLFLWSLK